MKKLLLSLGAFALIFVAGCVVESVYPYYTAKDLIFDSRLNGTWAEKNADVEPGESWKFEPVGEKAYWLTINGNSETNRYEAHLFWLKQQQFLDLCLTNRNDGMLPLHLLLKVEEISPSLKYRMMDMDWLDKLLQKNPNAVKHIFVTQEAGEDDKKKIVLTAETRELQVFVLKYVNDNDAFPKTTELKRR